MSETQLNPTGRVLLLSGANRGIGKAIAERLYADGYSISIGARDIETLAPVLSVMDGARAMGNCYDAKDRDAASAWVHATMEHFGRIDGVINNAGIMHEFRLDDADESALDEMWEVNVKGPLRVIRAALSELRAAGTGRIVNIVSLAGKRIKGEAFGGYGMTKHAAMALTHAVRYAGWDDGIRTTAICPGYVATDMTASASTPHADMTQPESVAHVVSMVLGLPNPVSVVEIPVNCLLEPLM